MQFWFETPHRSMVLVDNIVGWGEIVTAYSELTHSFENVELALPGG